MIGKDFSDVCGNTELIGHIKSEIRLGGLGHAYLLLGDDEAGKLSFAKDFAAALLCESKRGDLPCGECTSCKKSASASHPDIKTVDKGTKVTLGVDIIRELRSDAYIIPSEAEKKIYIIKDADSMTVQAQNAFLLTLEEPPAYVIFLLLCRDPSALLETIRSRAPSFTLCPAKDNEISEYITARSPVARRLRDSDRASWDELLVIANGNAGYAMELLEGDLLKSRINEKSEAVSLLNSLLSSDKSSYLTVASLKKTKRESAVILLTDMLFALRDMLVSKKVKECRPCFFTSLQNAQAAAAPYSAKKLSLTVDVIVDSIGKINSNAQITSTLLSMAVRIKDIK